MVRMTRKRRSKLGAFLIVVILCACAYGAYRYWPGITSAMGLPSSSVSSSQTSSAGGFAPSGNSVRYYFPRDGQAPEPVLVSIMGGAKQNLDVAIYSITDQRVADAMIAAEKRGVKVRMITDASESGTSSQKKLLATVKAAGIPIKINTHSGIMHLKVTIADDDIATTGSFNYTKSAEDTNDEVFVVLDDRMAAADFEAQFTRMWNDTSGFENY